MGNGANPTAVMPAFDSHHPPAEQLLKECVHCGFCLATCPTYALWGQEMDSPRGRIYLMRLGNDGQAALTHTMVGHFDKCLGCMACMTSCPSGVKYDKLIEATRAQVERRYPRPWRERMLRSMIFHLFPHPGRMRALLLPVWVYQKTGLQGLARKLGALPGPLRAMDSLLPKLPLSALTSDPPAVIPAQGKPRRRVGLLLGCVQRVFFSEVNAATIRVLSAEGCDVVIPADQPCCGALGVHAGRETEALDSARRTIDAFEAAHVDNVVINAAGCGSTMKDYGYLLREDPKYAERAKAFAAKCKDISELLVELGPQAKRHPLPLRVAYHDSCHLQHAQGVRTQPRSVLGTIPELKVVEVPEAALCCGSAGIYNLVQPETARELGDRKAKNMLTAQPELVVSANPGCLLQIGTGLQRAGSKVVTRHLVEVLDASLRAQPAASLKNSH